MRRVLVLSVFAFCLALFGAQSWANTYTFNFENGGRDLPDTVLDAGGGGTGGALGTYMSNIFGSAVHPGDGQWIGSSTIFGSDAFWTPDAGSRIDFDTAGRNASNWHITALQFDWAVTGNTGTIDFRLDLFDDIANAWTNSVFSVQGAVAGDTGSSPLLILSQINPAWEITRIRIHNNNTHPVGIDNLVIYDHPVPEPSTLLLAGAGLLAMAGMGRRRTA